MDSQTDESAKSFEAGISGGGGATIAPTTDTIITPCDSTSLPLTDTNGDAFGIKVTPAAVHVSIYPFCLF